LPFCPHCGAETQPGDTFCRACGKNMQSATTTPPAPTIQAIESAGGFRLQRLGKEEVAALLSFGLLALSAFLPWAEVLSLQVVSFTGIQYGPGITLLILSVIGAGAIFFPKKWTGYGCVLLGLAAFYESGSAMAELQKRVASIIATPYVSVRVGSGISLAVISSFFITADGVALILKRRQLEHTIKAAEAATMRLTSPPSIVTGKPETPRSARVSEFDVWIPILWLVIILLFSSERAQGWIGGLLMVFLATIWVYHDSKKRGMKNEFWIATLLLAAIGLPWYTYRLHKLRETQQ